MILTPYCLCDLQNFLPFGKLPFHFVNGFLFWAAVFQFDVIPCVYFCFCFPFLRRHIQKDIAKTSVKEYTDHVFF